MSSLTPMQQFAVDFIKNSKTRLHPGRLGQEWFYHKNKKYPPAASRDKFGTTSAAYKTLRKLKELGILKLDSNNLYILTEKGNNL